MSFRIAPSLRDLFLAVGLRDQLDDLGRAPPRDSFPCGTVSTDRSVIVGKDRWLFIHEGTNDWHLQKTGQLTLTPAGIDLWTQLFSRRKAYFERLGVPYAHIYVPEKCCVYPEYRPDEPKLSLHRPICQLMPSLGTEVLYPLDVLQAAKALAPTYYRSNSHWTWFGSYLVASVLWRQLGFEEAEAIPVVSRNPVQQDLAVKFEGLPLENYHELDIARYVVFTNETQVKGHVGRFKYIHNPSAENDLRVLIYGDSYAYDHNFAAWFSHQFRHIFCAWQSSLNCQLIETLRPDAVITQMAERYLVALPKDVLE